VSLPLGRNGALRDEMRDGPLAAGMPRGHTTISWVLSASEETSPERPWLCDPSEPAFPTFERLRHVKEIPFRRRSSSGLSLGANDPAWPWLGCDPVHPSRVGRRAQRGVRCKSFVGWFGRGKEAICDKAADTKLPGIRLAICEKTGDIAVADTQRDRLVLL